MFHLLMFMFGTFFLTWLLADMATSGGERYLHALLIAFIIASNTMQAIMAYHWLIGN